MGNFRTFYRGYALHIFGESPSWSFRAEPTRPELPLLVAPVQDGHDSWGKALTRAKRKIDRLLVEQGEPEVPTGKPNKNESLLDLGRRKLPPITGT